MKNGFSLTELLVTLVLSSFICLSLIKLLIHYQDQRRYHQTEFQINSQLQFAATILRQAILNSGYLGCGTLQTEQVHMHGLTNPPAYFMQGYYTQLPPFLQGHPLAKSDVIRLTQAVPEGVYLTKSMLEKNTALEVIRNPFEMHEWLIISDCHHADIFPVTSVQGLWLHHPPLNNLYQNTTQVFTWQDESYFIAETKRSYSNRSPILALYKMNAAPKQNDTPREEELVEDISKLEILYANNANASFMSAKQVTDWNAIKIVKITLTAQLPYQASWLTERRTFFVTLRNRLI